MDLNVLKQNFCELRTRTEEALEKLRRNEFLTEEETEQLVATARRLRDLQVAFSTEFGTEGQALFCSLTEIEKAVSDHESRLQAEKLSHLKTVLEEFLRLFSTDVDAKLRLVAAQSEAEALLHGEEEILSAADAEPYDVVNKVACEKEDSVRKDIVKPHRKLLGEKFGAEFVTDLLFGLIQAPSDSVDDQISETEKEHSATSVLKEETPVAEAEGKSVEESIETASPETEDNSIPRQSAETNDEFVEETIKETIEKTEEQQYSEAEEDSAETERLAVEVEEEPVKTPAPMENIDKCVDETADTSVLESTESLIEKPVVKAEEASVFEEPISTDAVEELEKTDESVATRQDDGRAEALARQLIDSRLEPSETEPYLTLIDRLLAQGEIEVASALAYALNKYGEQTEWGKTYANVEETLKYAFGFGADGAAPDYSYQAVGQHFWPEREWQFAARVCAYARALMQLNDKVDFSLLNNAAKPLIKGDGWDGFEKWKQAFNALCDLLKDSPLAFSENKLAKLEAKKDRANALGSCAKEAKELLGNFNTKYKAPRAPELQPLFRDFAPNSEVYKLVKLIADCKEKTEADVVAARAFCKKFCDEEGNFSEERVIDYFNEIGRKNGLKDDIYGSIKESLLTLTRDGVRLVKKWLSIVSGGSVENIDRIEKGRGRIAALLKEATRECPQNSPSAILLKVTAEDLSALLSGEELPIRDFSEFLQTDVIVLDEKMLPEFPIFKNTVTELRGYYRVLLHIAAKKDPLDGNTVQKRIDGDNFGMAQQICDKQHLERNISDDQYAKRDCEQHYSELKDSFEMELMRGHIDALFQSISLKAAETVFRHCCKKKNYGLCESLFKVLRNAADDEKVRRGKKWQAEFESFAKGKNKEEYPILESISSQLEAENYTVAELFLNQARGGEVAVDDDSLDETDVHGQFLEHYDDIRSFFKDNKWEDSTVQSLRQDKGKAARALGCSDSEDVNVEDAVDMLKHTVNFKDASWGKNFLKDLGFTVQEQLGSPIRKDKEGIRIECYKMSPQPKTLTTYIHPIGKLGTQLKELMLLRIGEGWTIEDALRKYAKNLNKPIVVVYFDGVMTKPMRWQLSKQLKKDFSSQTYLVIDQVLCAFLAGIKNPRRLSATLKCTLPYTYLDPYCGNGAGDIPGEMFFGRTHERDMLLDMQGNCSLVCGGRQLGKTALLSRVAEIAHMPNGKRFALKCGSRGAKRKDILDELKKELASSCKLNVDGNITDWKLLCERIVNWHESGAFKQLIIFIDEGDAFLEEDRADGYKVLQHLTDAVKKTEHAFKFVLAGLHNIARERHSDNSFALQLGEPCIIRPFTPREARQLVELPLLYLGFRFENEERQLPVILSHANYYPGLLHLFCSKLLTHLAENYTHYFNEKDNPPFIIEDRHIQAILSDGAAESKGFNSAVKVRFDATLDLDPRYRLLAQVMCILYREKEGQVGYSSEEIRGYVEMVRENGDKEISALECENLLREMCDLGVLSIVNEGGQNEVKFVFLRNVFHEYVSGVGCDVDTLYKMLEKQAKEVFK